MPSDPLGRPEVTERLRAGARLERCLDDIKAEARKLAPGDSITIRRLEDTGHSYDGLFIVTHRSFSATLDS